MSEPIDTRVSYRWMPLYAHPATWFAAVTLPWAVYLAAAGSIDGTLFLAGTLGAILVVRRLALPPTLELAAAVGVCLQGWGNALLLFERIGWYDKAVHFLTPMLVVPPLYLLLARVAVLPPLQGSGLRRATLGVFMVTTALGLALAAVWELVEGTADRWLGTSLAHGYFETIDDLYSSLLGSAAAGALLAWSVAAGRDELVTERVSLEVVPEHD